MYRLSTNMPFTLREKDKNVQNSKAYSHTEYDMSRTVKAESIVLVLCGKPQTNPS